MNVSSSEPHILLFERDQQLTTLLSKELTLAGYEMHIARTAVEVFDAIARFPIRLVMVDLAQIQASRREFWVALDAQRRGRGVQVFTFRCENVGGYGPDDPDERVETVLTDLEVNGSGGILKLVEAVQARVPNATLTSTTVVRRATSTQQVFHQQNRPARSPVTPRQPSVPRQPTPVPASQAIPTYQQLSRQAALPEQPARSVSRQQSQELPIPQVPAPAPTPAESQRPASSTFTDKIRAVFYPSSQSFSTVSEANGSGSQAQYQPAQSADVQPRPHASQRFEETDYPTLQTKREEVHSQAPRAESGLDQLSRMLRESQPAARNVSGNGHGQREQAVPQPGLTIDPAAIQEIRSQVTRAARIDEALERGDKDQFSASTISPVGMQTQLRASPIQDIPFEQDAVYRKGTSSHMAPPAYEEFSRQAMSVARPTQGPPPYGQEERASQEQARPYEREERTRPEQARPYEREERTRPEQEYAPSVLKDALDFVDSGTRPRPVPPPETPISVMSPVQVSPLSPVRETSPAPVKEIAARAVPYEEIPSLPEQVQTDLREGMGRRPAARTSDDMVLDIVKSLPPMSPPSQEQASRQQVLNGRATRSLGSVLLEGHLVPQERLQVAQHVQRMLRGVDLNYQLGEILLMFKLLSPDQLLAASLVSYGMISTVQISALGRIRQELHSLGLEYDLESLLVLFRILTPEQLREVRASWSG